ncbi:zinc finger Y-chromosomal protein 2-like [Cloeon dipterum]|uniref:zinc finger Y-chromosomal protein 2-like n=1 Tax=Cloeon dipterum TaxID=197152 RepID=UPI0032202394
MSFARPLCVLCERPAADGFVQAVDVDKEKLQTWLLNLCGYEFAEEIEDHDLICYFCIWHAEFLTKHGLNFGADYWWPQDLDYLDDAAKELRKSYFDGKIEQCWVQLENVDDLEGGSGTEHGPQTEKKLRKCVYCDKSYKNIKILGEHVRNAHKNAIRCENHLCATYFHTIEEKEEHVKNFHETPKERKKIQCYFCEKEFQGYDKYHRHVRHVHTEFPVKCSFRGCIKYFKTDDEMKSHFDSSHKEEDEDKIHECKHCKFRAKKKRDLERHIAAKHLPKTIKCEKCDKWFSSHRNLGFKCEPCKKYFKSAKTLNIHLKYQHSAANLKQCAHCSKSFSRLRSLKYHLAMTHNLIECQFECHLCKKKFSGKAKFLPRKSPE